MYTVPSSFCNAIPHESYPRYSKDLSPSRIEVEASCLVPMYPNIPHICVYSIKESTYSYEHPPKDGQPKWNGSGENFGYIVFDSYTLTLRNERLNGLFFEWFKNVFAIFKCKKQNNKPPQHDYLAASWFVKRPSSHQKDPYHIEYCFKIVYQDKVNGIEYVLLGVWGYHNEN